MSLEMYRVEKFGIRKENLYNSKGSALHFAARAGCLRTKSFTKMMACAVLGKEAKTIRHMLECDCIDPNPYEGNILLPEALGFQGFTEIGILVEEEQRGV